MKNLIALLLILLPGYCFAFAVQTPQMSGFNSPTMRLTGSVGGYSGGEYQRTGTVNINGKTVPIPGSVKPAPSMGNIIKNALKLNPYKIAGTLAAGWLIDQGLQWMEDQKQWVKTPPADTVGATVSPTATGWTCGGVEMTATACAQANGWNLSSYPINNGTITQVGPPAVAIYQCGGYDCAVMKRPANYAPAPVPMTDADWNALSDPMPTVAAEAPSAAYLPEGVTVVDKPAYTPQTVTVGQPYTKADGSTAQPMAKISPAGDGQVTIDTYEQPLTNPDGTAVPADTPKTDTQETPPPPPDPCQDNPDRLGCMNAGTDTFATPKKDIAFTFSPEASPIGAGSCPAPISVLGHQLSYQPMCEAMGMIRALIIAMSSLTAAFILVGAFKGGD